MYICVIVMIGLLTRSAAPACSAMGVGEDAAVDPSTLMRHVSRLRSRLEQQLQNFEVDYTHRYDRRLREEASTHLTRGRVRVRGACRSAESFGESTGAKSIEVINPRYAFSIQRDAGQRHDYLYSYDPSASRTGEIARLIDELVECRLKTALCVMFYPLDEVVSSGGKWEWSGAQPIEREGVTMWKISFIRRHGQRGQQPCWVILDPTHCWRAVESYEALDWGYRANRVDYHPGADMILPRRIVETHEAPAHGLYERDEWTCSLPKSCTAPEEAFTLTAYGFPEVRGSNWKLRAVLLAVSLFVIAALIVVAARHSRSAGSEPKAIAGA